MKRTTILAEEELLLAAKDLASREGKTLTNVFHEALAEYVVAHRQPRRLSIVGVGHSGRGDISERVDEILRAEAEAPLGWNRAPEAQAEPVSGS